MRGGDGEKPAADHLVRPLVFNGQRGGLPTGRAHDRLDPATLERRAVSVVD
jgi:hypothetical protein